ncbi:MAG TPA: aspartate 1-decarboxylase [Anaerolineales bacterium]|nr:aspartate 1-decarboxylase [Anaerolineales bacterium]
MEPVVYRTLLHSKIHRAVVTSADLEYEGSLKVDSALLEAAGMREYELVQVVDVENGARLETYLIAGEAGSGIVQPNGAAARLLYPGDHLIIMAFRQVPEPLPEKWTPTIVLVDGKNVIRETR